MNVLKNALEAILKWVYIKKNAYGLFCNIHINPC